MSMASSGDEPKRGRILPRDSGTMQLDLVIGVMAFLAALALGGVMIAQRSAESWQAGLLGRVTVQILPEAGASPDAGDRREAEAALTVLRGTQGIASARILSDSENLALVEPWLGQGAAIADLPFPVLIDVRLAPGAVPDMDALAGALKKTAPHAVIDDHSRWATRLARTAGTVVWSALAILMLIAVATAATVAFATRAGLAANREIVQLLHLMGAQDATIARAFEFHYCLAALAASFCGALAAGLGFLAAGGLDEIGLSLVDFLPPLSLRANEFPWLLLIPFVSALIAWATARLSVIAALKKYY